MTCHLQTVSLLPSQFGLLPFIFLLWLPRLGLPKLCWLTVGTVDILVLLLILEILSCFFTIENDISCVFVIWYRLYYVGVGSLYASFLQSFYHRWVLNLVESFLCVYWGYHMVSAFQLVNMFYHTDWFVYIEEALNLWDEPHLIMMCDLLTCCWTQYFEQHIDVIQWPSPV